MQRYLRVVGLSIPNSGDAYNTWDGKWGVYMLTRFLRHREALWLALQKHPDGILIVGCKNTIGSLNCAF
jgi:hypothetical protein